MVLSVKMVELNACFNNNKPYKVKGTTKQKIAINCSYPFHHSFKCSPHEKKFICLKQLKQLF